MRKAEWFIIMSVAILTLIVASIGADQNPQWKGKIETENGVKVVKNPVEPLFGDFAFDLEENLVIGGDPSKENAYFPNGATLNVDNAGNLYVVDPANRRVHMFDQAGKFVRAIGRQGQGPGEYTFPSQVLFDTDGNPSVWAAREMVYYGKDGVFKTKATLTTFINGAIIGPGGTIIGTTQPGRGPDGPKHTLIQLNANGTLLKTIAEYTGEFKKSQTAIILHAYSNQISFASLSDVSFIYGFSGDYRFHIADGEGRTTFDIAKDEKPIQITGKERSETQKNGARIWIGTNDKTLRDDDFPEYRPYFGRIFTDDVGRIYVIRRKSIFEIDKPSQIDVFSKDGYYLYRMTWGLFPSAIKGGSFYAVRENKETSEYQIVRYRIKNWSQMKNGL